MQQEVHIYGRNGVSHLMMVLLVQGRIKPWPSVRKGCKQGRVTQRRHQTSGQQEHHEHPPPPEPGAEHHISRFNQKQRRLGDLGPVKCTTGRGGEDSSPRRRKEGSLGHQSAVPPGQSRCPWERGAASLPVPPVKISVLTSSKLRLCLL